MNQTRTSRPRSARPGHQVQPANGQAVPVSQVSVRMYRQGLGDCFLLTFPTASGGAFFMVIDCGVILGTRDPETRMTAVAKDIRERTGGHVHLLVATHEHWDHLSGFIQAQDVFRDLTIETLWLAWTEDPTNALAKRLKAERRRTLRALHDAVEHLRATDPASDTPGRLEEILGFFGGLGASGGARTGDALAFLREHAHNVRFCRPGEPPLTLPGVPAVRIYVLGPPEDEALIKKSNPSKKAETYSVSATLTPEDAFLAAVRHHVNGAAKLPADEQETIDLSFPFDHCLTISKKQAQKDRFFEEHYGFTKNGSAAWRRIDTDWMDAAGPLALQLDSSTNNTSLALAIEVGDPGKVLLFPGDAQVGNWLSWERCSWSVEADGKKRHVTAADLLARTTLYKVGHHASHNATLRAQGLELMTSPELVAMIPVDHAMALKKRWDMPFQALLKRLLEKTSGRVVRIDTGVGDKPKAVSSGQWKRFLNTVTLTDLAAEVTVPF
jgi:hypothetical protein